MGAPGASDQGWAAIQSMEAAVAAHERGELEPLLLLPSQFGGDDDPLNVVFVPKGFVSIRDQTITDSMGRLIADGIVNSFTCEPEYDGDSFVPVRLRMRAWHTDKPGGVNAVLEIWKTTSSK